jgi:hypothetical protein
VAEGTAQGVAVGAADWEGVKLRAAEALGGVEALGLPLGESVGVTVGEGVLLGEGAEEALPRPPQPPLGVAAPGREGEALPLAARWGEELTLGLAGAEGQ